MMVKIDKDKCIRCGLCASMFDEMFDMLEGEIIIKEKGNFNRIQEAINNCPVDAIKN